MVSEYIPSASTCFAHISPAEHLKDLSALELSSCISAPLCDSGFSFDPSQIKPGNIPFKVYPDIH
jgi:hypothetical protein